MIKRRDLDYWRQEFKGITAKDIVHRIVTRFRPEQAEECDYDQDIVQDLLGQDSDDEDEPLMYAEEYENEEDTTMDFQTDTVLTDLSGKSTCLPDSVFYKYTKNLPSYWPDPKADDYQAFFRAFFFGEARGAHGHNWQQEINCSKSALTSERVETKSSLSLWQAAGYLHARNIVDTPSVRGCLFYWTPGSGKSIMVALLLDVLYHSHYSIYVVSSPQNTRQNDLDCCARSLLKYSPIFNLGGREPCIDDVKQMRKLLRNRPNGPPIFKKNYMTFRQFGRFCLENGPEKVLEKAAIIIDESHLLFDEKKCDTEIMWGTVLEALTRTSDSKVFTFSGTPGKNKVETLLQLELVRHASTRICHSVLLEDSVVWRQRLSDYTKGLVSYVDGTQDLSRYPINLGVDKVMCEMSTHQLINFSERCQLQLRDLGAEDLEELLAPIREGSGDGWKDAVRKARLTQTAGTAFWGGSKDGLKKAICEEEKVTLESLERYAPKLKAVVECILDPPDTEQLFTKHFVYSSNKASISYLAESLRCLQSSSQDGTTLFKQLFADDFEWVSGGEKELRLLNPQDTYQSHQILYVVLSGSVQDKMKLKAAFGHMTPDGLRFEGLRREDGSPLIQVLLGTHETNQGITLLRLQHIHLLEPNPKGWSEVR